MALSQMKSHSHVLLLAPEIILLSVFRDLRDYVYLFSFLHFAKVPDHAVQYFTGPDLAACR